MARRPGDALDVVRGSSSAAVSWRRERGRRVKTQLESRCRGQEGYRKGTENLPKGGEKNRKWGK